MESKINDEQIVDADTPKESKPSPFLKRVCELEKKVEQLDKKMNTILMALKSRR